MRLVICAFLLFAFMSVETAAWAGSTAMAPKDHSEAAFVSIPQVARLYREDGAILAHRVDGEGKFPNAIGKDGLSIESQRQAYLIIVAGLASEDAATRAQYIDIGLRALEWGFAQAGADGSFAQQRGGSPKKQHSLHNKSMFTSAAARSLLLLRQVPLDANLAARVQALVEKSHVSAQWMANTPDLPAFFARAKNTNQKLFIATGLQEAGIVSGDNAVTQKASELIRAIIDAQTPDGAFPENGGFDSSYHSVSLELMGRYMNTLPESPWRDTVMASLRKGTDRFLQAVDTEGRIDSSRNTRTAACGAPIAGTQAKGRDIDITPIRLYYLGFLLNEEANLWPIADRVQAVGQGFDHKEDCNGKGADMDGD